MPRLVAERSDVIAPMAEVFREHGYEGASLALIGKATGLGKGSLYHFFPGGKDEMLDAVLAEIDAWFEANVFAPLRGDGDHDEALARMFSAVRDYFRSGRRVCLVGALALGNARDRFAGAIAGYFGRWVEVLANRLERQGCSRGQARSLAQDMVAAIQGAIILSRALDDAALFDRVLRELQARHRIPS